MSHPGKVRRQSIPASGGELVRVSPLFADRPLPMVVTPAVPGVDLVEWARPRRAEVDQLLWRHKALLFRGFHQQRAEQLGAFAACTSEGQPLEYRDRSTPRTQVGDRIYTSTVYPADRRINLHNEGTYWNQWPLKLYFACAIAAARGGETPIADVSRVLQRLRPEVRERFATRGFRLERHYNDGFGLTWQAVFQTEERAEVERFCREKDIEFQWLGGDRLVTRQTRPAIRVHPRSGQEVWFNHAAFFHVSAHPPEIRQALVAELGPDGLPYNTFYGDGSEIEPHVVAEIMEAYRDEQVMFPWEPGDILLLDNMTVAHAREPYAGDRKVLVAMYEPVGDTVA